MKGNTISPPSIAAQKRLRNPVPDFCSGLLLLFSTVCDVVRNGCGPGSFRVGVRSASDPTSQKLESGAWIKFLPFSRMLTLTSVLDLPEAWKSVRVMETEVCTDRQTDRQTDTDHFSRDLQPCQNRPFLRGGGRQRTFVFRNPLRSIGQ